MKKILIRAAATAGITLSLVLQAGTDIVAQNQKLALDSAGNGTLKLTCSQEAVPSHIFQAECVNKEPLSSEVILFTTSGKTFRCNVDLPGTSGPGIWKKFLLEGAGTFEIHCVEF